MSIVNGMTENTMRPPPGAPNGGPGGWIDLSTAVIDPQLAHQLPEPLCRKLRVMLVGRQGDQFRLAMANPAELPARDEVQRLLGGIIVPLQADASALDTALDYAYREYTDLDSLAQALQHELDARRERAKEKGAVTIDAAQDAPVVQLLERVFAHAIRRDASDIHLEPQSDLFRIRQRVDGVLSEQVVRQPSIFSALVIRLKLMADMDISERRLPQEGRFEIQVNGSRLEVRIATMPTRYGEAVVMRLLNHGCGRLALERLGLSGRQREAIESVLRDPQGTMLVVGPTGSGKTTTLYSALKSLDQTQAKLITVEDPIEYELPRATQVQVNPRIGLGFADVLRAALRSDPDVIMVGEMRDSDTATIALRAALTGHLVLSTMHCSDAASTIPRLLDMGVEPYLVASAVRLVVAQRLIRVLCTHCASKSKPKPAEIAWIEGACGTRLKKLQVRVAVGCAECEGTGYRGRVGIYEVLVMDGEVIDALRRNDLENFSYLLGRKMKSIRLIDGAVSAVESGKTSIGELQRVFGQNPEIDSGISAD